MEENRKKNPETSRTTSDFPFAAPQPSPPSADSLNASAVRAALAGDVKSAREGFLKALAIAPHHHSARLNLELLDADSHSDVGKPSIPDPSIAESSIAPGISTLRAAHPWPLQRPTVPTPERHLGWLEVGTKRLLADSLSRSTELVVELGAWLGMSTRFLVETAPNAVVVSIDHWQGSPEHRRIPEWQAMLPTLFESFLALCWNHRDRIIPVRKSTLQGLLEVARHGLSPELIYVDAEHSISAVSDELELASRLFPNAGLIGDDWAASAEVRVAVEGFAARNGMTIESLGNGWKLMRAVHPR